MQLDYPDILPSQRPTCLAVSTYARSTYLGMDPINPAQTPVADSILTYSDISRIKDETLNPTPKPRVNRDPWDPGTHILHPARDVCTFHLAPVPRAECLL